MDLQIIQVPTVSSINEVSHFMYLSYRTPAHKIAIISDKKAERYLQNFIGTKN